jgi:hypothetical protein
VRRNRACWDARATDDAGAGERAWARAGVALLVGGAVMLAAVLALSVVRLVTPGRAASA